ncbi:protein KAKU4 isoform X1 [Quillaja saponaria]|uniref:Protein KAKU4 isoform X1 n=1 Tax=Quillaja saponaria TaxID=32244 RepID=A0AAD7PT10_QUISA|nr:protein KAKU4 isoform X1 [Quillaja saponaria]
MATVPRSGGKIVRTRRTARVKTPYDRPNLPNPDPQNPNWLSRFILSPTRSIATGAGKLLLSAIYSESSESSSGSDSEDEVATDNEDNDVNLQDHDELRKSGALVLIGRSGKEPQPAVANSKTKHVIEQLLKQETFSREECDRLTEIIQSRVDCRPNRDAEEGRPNDVPEATVGSDLNTPDLYSTAILEAKKWLKEKKSIFGLESDLHYGTCSSLPVTLPQASEDEVGSPADIAKSYMQARPPWASPSMEHIRSPSSVNIKLFKEELPYSISGNSTSTSKLKRNSPASGSWNIQDEIRRVRARATEEMLRTLPSKKIDWSSFALENKNNVQSEAPGKLEATGDLVRNPTIPIDTSSNRATGLSNSHSSPVMERKQDAFLNEAFVSDPVIINSEQNQGFEAVPIIEGPQDVCREITCSDKIIGPLEHIKTVEHSGDGLDNVDGIDNTSRTNHLLSLVAEEIVEDSRLHDRNCSMSKEMVEAKGAVVNGSPPSGSSLYAEQGVGGNTTACNEGNSPLRSSHGIPAKGNPDEEVCQLLSESSIELLDLNVNDSVATNEDDGVANGSQNSSSMLYDELRHDQSHQESQWTMGSKTNNSFAEKPGKRITRYNRRGRGRGK